MGKPFRVVRVFLPIAAFISAINLCAVPITEVVMDLNHIKKCDTSNGDTWDPFWADDGNLYAFNCDGRGFGNVGRNLAFNELTGDAPETLSGRMINTMDDYGKSGLHGPDGATWKALGQECIDGVFYSFVSRHTYGKESKDPWLRQTAVNASLIKSTDRGATWTRSAAENYEHPMWPGGRFGAPFFIHYGQNGGSVTNDAADKYVYAISDNGFWDDGDDYILARVPRNKIAALNAADWAYYTGGDGMDASNWTNALDKAVPVFQGQRKCGTTAPCYVPALGVYLMTVWYTSDTLKKWFQPDGMVYDFYQAEHPWGPWKFINSCNDKFLTASNHMYGPNICAKFQERVGDDVQVWLFHSGCPFKNVPQGLYKFWSIPLILRTTPPPAATWVNDDDPAIVYHGSWVASAQRGYSDYKDDVHYTTTAGDWLEYKFHGSGIELISEKSSEEGRVEITLDGRGQVVSLQSTNFPRISQVTVFRHELSGSSDHTLKIVNQSGCAMVDAFKVLK